MKSKKINNKGLKSNFDLISNENTSNTSNNPVLNRVEEMKQTRDEVNKYNKGMKFDEGIINSENYLIQNTITSADEFVLDNDKFKKDKIKFEDKSNKSPEELDKINMRKLQVKFNFKFRQICLKNT